MMLVIRKDVPLPPRMAGPQTSKYAPLKHMDVMDCVYAPSKKDADRIGAAMKKMGFKVSQRKQYIGPKFFNKAFLF